MAKIQNATLWKHPIVELSPRRRFGVAGGRKRKFLRRFVFAKRRDEKQRVGGSGGGMGCLGINTGAFAGKGVFCGKDGVAREKQRDFSGVKMGLFKGERGFFAGWKGVAKGGLKC